MPKLSRVGDQNNGGGKIKTGAQTVFANGLAVGVHTSDITPHSPNLGNHARAKTSEGSPTVFAEGKPVLRVGSANSCGHKISQGSSDVDCQ